MTGKHSLAPSESIALSAALIAQACHQTGIQALIVKGLASIHHGLRPFTVMADLDLLVSPQDCEPLRQVIESRGWKMRVIDPDDIWPVHSLTFYHDHWPTDIDLHLSFPGFGQETESVFAALWDNRVTLESAGLPVNIPSRTDQWIIDMLHSARAPWTERSQRDLAYLGDLVDEDFASDILRRGRITGALPALKPHLSEQWFDLSDIPDATDPEWTLRLSSQYPGQARMAALKKAELKSWPRILLKSVYQTREQLSFFDSSLLEAGHMKVLRANLQRWKSVMGTLFSGRDSANN